MQVLRPQEGPESEIWDKTSRGSWTWLYTPVIPALGRSKQQDQPKFRDPVSKTKQKAKKPSREFWCTPRLRTILFFSSDKLIVPIW
jgi:hypothetical protein